LLAGKMADAVIEGREGTQDVPEASDSEDSDEIDYSIEEVESSAENEY
jgi:hypothetical protein